MINHVSIGTADLARAGAFYDGVLRTLGYARVFDEEFAIAYGVKWPVFWINYPENRQPASVGNGVHIALIAPSRDAVDAFHAAALKAGGSDAGPPGIRTYAEHYYAAYVRDPDGNKIEAVHMPGVPFPTE